MTEEIAEKKIEEKPKLLYVRDLSEYLYCPRKVFLKLNKKFKEKTNPMMIKGMIKHMINDMLNEKESEIVQGIFTDLNLEEIKKIYYENIKEFFDTAIKKYAGLVDSFYINPDELFSEINEKLEPEIEEKAKVIAGFIKKFKGRELWESIEPKFISEYRLVDYGLGLSGRVDKIELTAEGVIPIEIKTGKLESGRGAYDSDILQLTAYAIMLENKFGKPIKFGKLVYKNKKFDIDITEENKQKVVELIDKIKNMVFIPQMLSNFAKCKNCGLREECMNTS
jgi:CRISPR-associated protein Cas4